ncbi:MAG: PAS domain S-box protein [Cyclobacteriaceae bacterium]|nr:PAS domain S-box protein [Cyclobacteriaceae bacterium]
MQELSPGFPAVFFTCAVRADGSAKLLSVTDNCEGVLGVRAHELLETYSVCEKIIFADDLENFKTRISEALSNSSPWSWIGRIQIKGSTRWIEIRTAPPVQSNELRYQGLILDITERKWQEEERLKKNEALFTKLFNTVPLAVVMLDVNGKVLLVNRGFNEMFGYELIELRGKNLNDFIVPEKLQSEGIDLNNLIASNNLISVETTRRHKSGRPVDVILYGVPVTLDEKAIGIYGVYVDISERKKIEEELKTRNTELDNFVYKVSHDLRAPLSSILGLINLSKLPGNTDDLRTYFQVIEKKVHDLDHFISDVLSHSKNLKMEVSISKIDLKSIISKTFADLSYLPGASEVEVTTRVSEQEFYSDPWRISEIFRNLISNAIKYRQPQTARAMVHVTVEITPAMATIIFADNGIGISEEDIDKIFDMFYRATERSDGSGIGLYIVKNAVEKLGGKIAVSSKVGFGTTFTIHLPNARADQGTGSFFQFADKQS